MIWIPRKRDLIVPNRFRRAEPERRGVCGLAGIVNPYSLGGASFRVGAINMASPSYVRSALLTGQAASKKFIFSAWVNPTATGGQFFQGRDAGGTSYIGISVTNIGANCAIQVTASDLALNTLLSMQNSVGYSTGSWHHVAMACDLTVAGARMIMVDGVNDTSVTTFSNTANFAFDLCTDMGWGNNRLTSNKIPGCIAEMYFAMGQYLDLTVAANLAKFRDASNHPVDLGATGSTPTGSAPSAFSHIATGTGVATDWATNRAGNGNWTPAGTPALCGTTP